MQEQLDLLDIAQRTSMKVRESKRAKNITIHVIPHQGIEVVVPYRTPASVVQRFVEKNKNWIEQTQRELDESTDAPIEILPEQIHLKAIDKMVRVEYQCVTGSRGWRYLGKDSIGLGCARADFEVGRAVLLKWLQHEGKRWLVPWLYDVRDELGLSFKRVQVRGQRTRWGSYSSSGTLSINYYLMLLEPQLVRYLFIHELCHTVHLNHSRQFWRLVARFDRHYKKKERHLNQTKQLLPAWLLSY